MIVSLKYLKEFLKRNDFLCHRISKTEKGTKIKTEHYVKELKDKTQLAVDFVRIGKGLIRVSILTYNKECKKFVWLKDSKGEVLYDKCPEFIRDYLVSTYKEITN